MKWVFQHFVETVFANPDAMALCDAMESAAEAFELSRFAYLMAPRDDPNDVKLISNYPVGWTSRYLAHGYEKIDPVVSALRRAGLPFLWGGECWTRPLDKNELELLEEASAFGLRCGFTFPICDPASSFAAVTFASDRSSAQFRRCFEVHRDVLELMALVFHAEARRALAPLRSVGGIRLTCREFECLEWASRGKSAWDIGRIIGISRRTVTFHLNNTKVKLGVRTIQQAVALFAASRRAEN